VYVWNLQLYQLSYYVQDKIALMVLW
jgi:hypothetical protein